MKTDSNVTVLSPHDVGGLAPSSIALMERAAIDSQIATAHAFPRSLEKFKSRALGIVTLDLETAESCIYSRPVGGGKVAEGESIRMAEIVAACYGNLRVASRIVEQTERFVRCEGVAHDLESNYAGKSECIEPTVKTDGTPYSESQRAVVAKACLSKAYRDAVFKVVPKAVCKTITIAAKGVINKEVATIEQRIERIKGWLKLIKVTDARVFAVLAVKGWADVNDEHILTLTGLRTAINEGTKIEEAFPSAVTAPKIEGGAGADTLFPPTATGAGGKTATKLDELMSKLTTEITEPLVLDYMVSKKLCDANCKTLADLFAKKPTTIQAVLLTWDDAEKTIRAAIQRA